MLIMNKYSHMLKGNYHKHKFGTVVNISNKRNKFEIINLKKGTVLITLILALF